MSHHHHGHSRHHDRQDRREMRGAHGDRPFGRHRHGGGGGHGGRGRRPFEQGELRFVLLQMIAEAPRHGYELIKAIEDKFAGSYSPSPGVVYPTLTMLEELGYATLSASEGGKKLYAATPDGIAFLDANRPAVDASLARMQAARGSLGAPQIHRAMENLKLALRMRLSAEVDEDRIRAIAAAIDAAAVEIERT